VEQKAVPAASIQNTIPLNAGQEKKADGPRFLINCIMYLDESPRAIINNAMVEVGDAVDGATVVKIEKRRVLLLHNEEEIALGLN